MSGNVTVSLATQGTSSTTTNTLSPGSFATGVNLDGLEYNAGNPNAQANYDYAVPSASELAYYHSQGINLIRLPFAWERMQPTLNGPLNAAYVSQIESVVNAAAALGMKVILDAHDYGGYGNNKLGDGTLTDSEFANMWQQVATTFAGNSGIAGYDLMNEPSNMPNVDAWPDAAQAAITAIRTADSNTTIYVEGDDYSSAGSWAENNPTLASLVDPSNNLVFSAHLYLDTDNSGTHFDWAQQQAAGDNTDVGVQRLSDFVGWLQANNLKGDIGEIGVGNDNTDWLTALDKTLAYAQASNLQVTYWAGGPWWGSYPMAVDPVNGVTAPQLAVLDKYSGDMETVTSAALSGTGDADATIYLSENDVQLATTTTDANGNWSYTLTGLANGAHIIVVSEVPPGQDGIIAALSFILAAPSSTSSSSSSGSSSSNNSSSNNSSSSNNVSSSSNTSSSSGSSSNTSSNSSTNSTTTSGSSANTSSTPPVVSTIAHVLSNTAITGATSQDVFRVAAASTSGSITNFAAGSAGDTLQLIGASSYTISDYHVSDILWDGGAFAPYLWELNSTSVIGGGAIEGGGSLGGYHVTAVGDFNGDGVSDMLLTAANAPAVMWFIGHGTVTGGAVLPYGAAPSTVAWSGDFNGDGKSDILWDNGSNAPYLWEMNGSTAIGAAALGFSPFAVVAPGYHIAGIGDFNGDGKSDILWASDSVNPGVPTMLWFMNGLSASAALLPFAAPSTKAWTGDFNGDGYSDILWDGQGGVSVIWEMKGTSVVGVGVLGGIYGYHIAGVGDFNGDGKSDILWAANMPSPNAPALIWFMNGTSVSGAELDYGASPTNAFIGDFNLDGTTVTSNTGASVVLDNVDQHTTAINVQTLNGTFNFNGQTAGVTASLVTGTSSVSGEDLTGYQNIVGTAFDDTLRGYGPNYISTLTGNGGNDTYQFGAGDGTVTVVNGVSANSAATGQVDFMSNINDQDLWFVKSGSNLVVDVLGTNDQLTIKNWYGSAAARVGEFVDAGGLKLDSALSNLVHAMATFSAANPAFNPQGSGTAMPADATVQSTIAASWHS